MRNRRRGAFDDVSAGFVHFCLALRRARQDSDTAKSAIDSADSSVLLSDVTALEITLKWSAGKIALPDPPRLWIESQIAVWSLDCLALGRQDTYRAGELPEHHRDPFEGLLVAVALNSNATILTSDKAVHAYPVSCRW